MCAAWIYRQLNLQLLHTYTIWHSADSPSSPSAQQQMMMSVDDETNTNDELYNNRQKNKTHLNLRKYFYYVCVMWNTLLLYVYP